jgi:hypothetical protein
MKTASMHRLSSLRYAGAREKIKASNSKKQKI